jgi:hypothetical protein
MTVSVFNWIRAEFASGRDFISDAPDTVAQAIELAVRDASGDRETGCIFGTARLASHELSCVFMRYATATSGTAYVHAFAWDGSLVEPSRAQLEGIFATRYGVPPLERVRELVRRLARLPVAQATLPLTDLFVEASDLASLRAASPRPTKAESPAAGRRAASGIAALPWVVAAAATGIAGFLIGRVPPDMLAPVAPPPPELEIERRLAQLESDRGVADVSLRIQLQHERRLHEESLAARDREIAQLELELEAAEALVAALRPPGADPTEVAVSTPPRLEPAVAAAPFSAVHEPTPIAAAELERELVALPDVAAPPLALVPPAGQQAVVRADLLWVREGPGTEHRRFRRLTAGTPVVLSGASEQGWSRIVSPAEGWVATEYLELQAEASTNEPSDDDVAVVVRE